MIIRGDLTAENLPTLQSWINDNLHGYCRSYSVHLSRLEMSLIGRQKIDWFWQGLTAFWHERWLETYWIHWTCSHYKVVNYSFVTFYHFLWSPCNNTNISLGENWQKETSIILIFTVYRSFWRKRAISLINIVNTGDRKESLNSLISR